MFLRPKNDILDINGKVSYSESSQAWNTIRFKRALLREFPQLREKSSYFGYKLVFYKSYEELENAVKSMKESEHPLPILLFFYRL